MKRYFIGCNNLDELKREYRRLCMLHHPDRGGDTVIMQAINAEYDAVFPRYKIEYNKTSAVKTEETSETDRQQFYTQNGWAGCNYKPGKSLKEIAAEVRKFIKEHFPTYKFSVRTSHASMCQELHVDMKEAPCKIYKEFDELTWEEKSRLVQKAMRNGVFALDCWTDAELRNELERIWKIYGNYYRCLSDQIKTAVEAVDSYVNSFNRSDCDGMIDYFDVNFYYFGCCQNNGEHVAFVPRTARITAKRASTAVAMA